MAARKRSDIWNHYEIGGPREKKAKCTYCLNKISVVGGSTSNLSRHMKAKHPTVPLRDNRILDEAGASKNLDGGHAFSNSEDSEANIATTSRGKTNELIQKSSSIVAKKRETKEHCRSDNMKKYITITNPLPLFKSKIFDNQLIKVIVKEYLPFRIVESSEFKRFIAMLNPGYKLPCRKTVSHSLIPQLYIATKENVKLKLINAEAVSLTTDGWTSLNNQSFWTVTVHFIDENTYTLESFLLGCTKFNERHTAENLAEFLKKTIVDWDINNKVSAVSSDNAANIVAAIKICGFRHIACFAHTLNLIVQEGLKTIKPVIDKIKAIVEFFKRSSHGQAKLSSLQEQMNLPDLKLKQDVVTRWNSTFDMLDRILKIKDAVISTLALLNTGINIPSPEEWQLAEESKKVLQIFYEMTTETSAEKTLSLSKIPLFVAALNNHLTAIIVDQGILESTRKLAQNLKEQVSKRFQNIEDNELICQATILDPRFKKHGFSSDDKFDKALMTLKKKIRGINLNHHSSNDIAIETNSSDKKETSFSSLWESFEDKVKDCTEAANKTAASIIELDRYLQEPLIKRWDNPILWWGKRKLVYPRLYQLVLRRLCIMATSVPSERIFSKAGETLTEKRSRLNSSKFSEIMFLNANL